MKTKLIGALVALSLFACGPNFQQPVDSLTGVGTSALDQRTGFVGTWGMLATTTVNGSDSVVDTTMVVASVGAGNQMSITDEHGCVIGANATSTSTLTTSGITCPAWLDTASCPVTTTYAAGTGSLASGSLTLNMTGVVARQCPGGVTMTPIKVVFTTGH